MPARPERLSLLLVLAVAVLAHARGLGGGFVYDDHRFIEHNAALEPLRPLDYLLDPGTASAASGEGVSVDIYRPLRTLLFGLERAVFGANPRGWHFVSLLLHALNAWLVLRVLRALLCAEGPAVVGAVLFAAHPVTVESVAWLSSQGDLLALTLMLSALLVLGRAGAARTLLGTALTALACLAKESAVVLPALLLLRDRSLPEARALPWRTTLLRTLLLALVVVGYVALRNDRMPAPDRVGAPAPEGGLLARLAQVEDPGLAANARKFLSASTWYAGALVWPSGFRLETDLLPPLSWGEPEVVLGLGLWLSAFAAGLLAWRRGRPAVLLFAAWGAAAALVPVSQIFVPLKTLAAERFLYPVLPCLVAGLGAGLVALGRRLPPGAAWGGLLLALPLVVVCHGRTGAWADEESLWRAVRQDRPWNTRAYEGLGFALLQKGRYQDAERAYTAHFEAWPYDGKAHFMFAGHLESLAETLNTSDPRIAATSDILERRREVLWLTIHEFGRALSIWDEVGLAAGRGSPAMVWGALGSLHNASLEFGDLDMARLANDRMIVLSGIADPRDTRRVLSEAPHAQRRARWNLAWRALTPPPGKRSPEAEDQMLRTRAAMVGDMGLDPMQPDDVLLRALEPPLLGLIREAEAALEAGAGTRSTAFGALYELWLVRAALLERTGRASEARPLREQAERRRLAEPTGAAK